MPIKDVNIGNVMKNEIYDVLGVGLGWSNLSLKKLLESSDQMKWHIIEAKSYLVWYNSMLLKQNAQLGDKTHNNHDILKPSFISYAHSIGKLDEYLNHCLNYCKQIKGTALMDNFCNSMLDKVDFNSRLLDIEAIFRGRDIYYKITCNTGIDYYARNLILETNRLSIIPKAFQALQGLRVFHSSNYLENIGRYNEYPKLRVAVIGDSAHATNIMIDLFKRFPDIRLTHYIEKKGIDFALEYASLKKKYPMFKKHEPYIEIHNKTPHAEFKGNVEQIYIVKIEDETTVIDAVRERYGVALITQKKGCERISSETFEIVILATGSKVVHKAVDEHNFPNFMINAHAIKMNLSKGFIPTINYPSRVNEMHTQ